MPRSDPRHVFPALQPEIGGLFFNGARFSGEREIYVKKTRDLLSSQLCVCVCAHRSTCK